MQYNMRKKKQKQIKTNEMKWNVRFGYITSTNTRIQSHSFH